MQLPRLVSIYTLVCILLVVAIAYIASKAYAVATNPLSRVPGPTISKWTNLRLKYAVLTGERVRYIHALHRRYGPIVRVSPDEVSLANIASAKTIYKMGSHFYKATWYNKFIGQFKFPSLFTMTDQHQHGQHRRLMANSFSEKWIKNMEPYIAKNVLLATNRIRDDAQANGYADVFKWFMFMATDVIGEASFGESFRMLETGKKNQYMIDLETVGSRGMLRSELPWLATLMMYIPFGPAKEIQLVVGRMVAYATQSIDRYWKQLQADPENVKPTLLTKNYADFENGLVPLDQLKRDAVGNIVAGTDTTAITAMYAVWQCSRFPELEQKLIREVSTLQEGFDDEDLKQLKYLDDVVLETLRLNGAIQQGLPRTVQEGGADFCGYYIPAGKIVGVQSYTMHRDPNVWRDPETFDPSRWDEATKEMKDSYYPFGGGSRVCIGMHFAQLELRYALAHFYRTFPAGVRPAFVEGFTEDDMVQVAYFLSPPKGKKCYVTPRK